MISLTVLSVLAVGIFNLCPTAQAQTITPDGTAGTVVNLTGDTFSISGGVQAGRNLFHSFQKFGLNTGFNADFIDPGGIFENIVGRVTGGVPSNIDGRLQAFTNLYLLNPAGVLFGPNASLNVNGSFYATTADRVVFGDESFFSATDVNGGAFSVAAPEQFGFLGSNPGGITVNQSILSVPVGDRIVLAGGDIAIERGSSGFLSARDGRIDLVSVASAAEFDLTSATPSLANFNALGAVNLSNSAFLDVRGDGGGKLFIRGGQILVRQSILAADTSGAVDGAVIDIEARGNATLDGGTQIFARPLSVGTPDGVRISGANISITGNSRIDVNGDGGSRINITGGDLFVEQSILTADMVGSTGNGGVAINLSGDATFNSGSQILARNGSSVGSPFGVSVSAKDVTLINDAQLVTDTFGSSPGGGINITATGDFAIRNNFAFVFGLGGLFSDSFATGASGAITVNALNMTMNEGEISAEPKASGLGGPVSINADSVEFRFGAVLQGSAVNVDATSRVAISGTTATNFPNFFQSFGANTLTFDAPIIVLDDSFAIATGGIIFKATDLTIEDSNLSSDGGISVDAANVTIRDGGKLSTITAGSSNSGDIAIKASNSVTLAGSSRSAGPSISAAVLGTGNVGAISLIAPDITITNGKVVNNGNNGAVAGSILISGETIRISGETQIDGSIFGSAPGANVSMIARKSISITAEATTGEPLIQSSAFGVGPGGRISLVAPTLSIKGGAIVAFSGPDAGSTGIGGTIDAVVDILTMEDALMSASTSGQANAGSVNVTANTVLVGLDADISSNTQGTGKGGVVNVTANSVIIRGGGTETPSFIDSTTSGLGDAGEVNLNVGTLTLESGGGVQTSALLKGIAKGGTININASDRVTVSGKDSNGAPSGIASFGVFGDSGNINITAPELILFDGGVVEASNTNGNAGAINLDVGRLTLGDSGFVSAFTQGIGEGGRILIIASQEVSIASGGGILTSALGPGAAGEIDVRAPFLNITGGVITSGSNDVGNKIGGRTGPAGRVLISVDRLSVAAGGKIDSGTSSTIASSVGGDVNITVTGSATINGVNENGSSSSIQSNTTGAASGGAINVRANDVTISGNGAITSKSTGAANASAGDIFIIVANNLTMIDGAITTEAAQADGGNIKLTVVNTVRLVDSTITSSVGQGLGGGGNIDIDPVFVILAGSQVIANAFGGPGGNITIVTEQFLASPDSVIQASSQLGIDGNVEIDAPDSDAAGALAILPSNFVDAASHLAQQCSARGGRTSASFVAAGRGGLPVRPGGPLPAFYHAPYNDVSSKLHDISAAEGSVGSLAFEATAARLRGDNLAGTKPISGSLVLSCSG